MRVEGGVFGDQELQLAGVRTDLNIGCLTEGMHHPINFTEVSWDYNKT
jgi:hypothetical protein